MSMLPEITELQEQLAIRVFGCTVRLQDAIRVFVISIAMDRQRVSRLECFGTHCARVVARKVDVLDMVRHVLFPCAGFVAHQANKQILFNFPHTRFDSA